MAPGADENCSWSATPASKKAKDETCAIEAGHSTPVAVRGLREGILQSKQAQEERRRASTPDPALYTVHGFVVDPQRTAVAAPDNHHRAATAESVSARMSEPSEVTMAHVASTARTMQAANQAAMQRNRLINVVAADAAITANYTKPGVTPRHVMFVPDAKPPHHPQPKKTKTKEGSPPPPPPPTPSQQEQFTATAPQRIGINAADTPRLPPWTESYRCVYKNPDCPTCAADKDRSVCHRTCEGATAWCSGDKRFVPHMPGPHRCPDGSEGKPIPEFDLEEAEEDSVKF